MALDAVPGAPTANSYVTVPAATAYLDERLHTEPWYAQLPGDQTTLVAKREAALITATRLLDQEMLWVGTPSTTTQALGWPRSGLLTPAGLPVDPLTVPAQVQRATAYYALALLRDTSEAATSTSTTVASGTIKRQTLGETTIEYFQPGTSATGQVTRSPQSAMPSEIRQMLRGYGAALGGMLVPLART
jgi:DnaT-like ssDNA binding protein